jgi:hypothetical protein
MKITPLSNNVIIETIDGRAFVGTSLKDVVQKIRASAWACTDSTLRGYMQSVARRASEWTKRANVRTDTIDNFVYDMEACGLYRVHRLS